MGKSPHDILDEELGAWSSDLRQKPDRQYGRSRNRRLCKSDALCLAWNLPTRKEEVWDPVPILGPDARNARSLHTGMRQKSNLILGSPVGMVIFCCKM